MIKQPDMLIAFAEDLAVLLNSGADLDSALAVMAEAWGKGAFSDVLSGLRASVRQGEPLSVAMGSYPQWFDQYMIGMVHSGEASGQLALSLERLAAQLESDHDLKTQISSSLVYPSILMVTMSLSLLLILGVILPRLGGLFESFSEQLSPAASALFKLGSLVNDWGLWILACLGTALIVAYLMRHQLQLKNRVLSLLKKVPAIKIVLNQIEFARFTATLSSLLESGLAPTHALEIASHSFKHDGNRQQMQNVISKVNEGQMLSVALAELDGFAELHRHSIASGEQGGQLPNTLNVLSKRLQKDFSKRTQRIAMLLEPVLIVTLGLVIGLVVYAVFSAMQGVGDLPL